MKTLPSLRKAESGADDGPQRKLARSERSGSLSGTGLSIGMGRLGLGSSTLARSGSASVSFGGQEVPSLTNLDKLMMIASTYGVFDSGPAASFPQSKALDILRGVSEDRTAEQIARQTNSDASLIRDIQQELKIHSGESETLWLTGSKSSRRADSSSPKKRGPSARRPRSRNRESSGG